MVHDFKNHAHLQAKMASLPSSSKKKNLVIIFIVIIVTSSSPPSSSSPSVGVSFNPSSPGLPSGHRIVSALSSAGITDVHLYDPDPQTLRSFLYTDISLLLSPTTLPFPLNRSHARQWLSTHILPFHPRIHVTAISLTQSNITATAASLQTLHSACARLGLPTIPVSTVHPFPLLMDPSFPPSEARFRANLTKSLRPILAFLSSAGSPFLVDVSPFHLWRADPTIPIGYALFKEEPFGFRDDPATGLRYRNLFDAMVDAVFAALEDVGYRHLQVVVIGTGWPTEGAKEANAELACSYNTGLVQHLRSGMGTPMRREGVKAVYVRELFDDMTRGRRRTPEWERHWGIWFANLSHKYELDFSGSGSRGGFWAGAMVWCCWLPVLLFLHYHRL